MQRDSPNLDLATAVRILRRRGPLVVVCIVLTAVAAFVVSKTERKQYTANATILFQDQQLDQQAAGLTTASSDTSQGQTDTNLRLASLPRIAAATAAAVGHGTTGGSVSNAVNVSEQSDTDLATVAATASSPALAAQIANEYSQQVIAYRGQSDRAYYSSALRAINLQLQALPPAQQHGAEGADLKDRIASLQILSHLQGNEVQLAQPASTPPVPSSPKTGRNVALGAALGLLLGLGVAFVLENFDRRIREPGDLEEAYDLPLVGVIPEAPILRTNGSQSTLGLPPRETEIFGLLRAHLRYLNVDRKLRVITIVSAAPGDGKSTVARNLALAAANVGERVLFVEADLRRPTAANMFGVSRGPGIAEILIDGLPLEDAVQRAELLQRGDKRAGLDVLVAGTVLPPNPAQVTESQAMAALFDKAKKMYDLVVVDTPPLAVLPDAFPLLRLADGILVVGRLGKDRRDVALRLRSTLQTAGAPMTGVVANGYRQRRGAKYGYGDGYGYGYEGTESDGAGRNGAGRGIPTSVHQ